MRTLFDESTALEYAGSLNPGAMFTKPQMACGMPPVPWGGLDSPCSPHQCEPCHVHTTRVEAVHVQVRRSLIGFKQDSAWPLHRPAWRQISRAIAEAEDHVGPTSIKCSTVERLADRSFFIVEVRLHDRR